jgi:hypothetical protein
MDYVAFLLPQDFLRNVVIQHHSSPGCGSTSTSHRPLKFSTSSSVRFFTARRVINLCRPHLVLQYSFEARRSKYTSLMSCWCSDREAKVRVSCTSRVLQTMRTGAQHSMWVQKEKLWLGDRQLGEWARLATLHGQLFSEKLPSGLVGTLERHIWGAAGVVDPTMAFDR